VQAEVKGLPLSASTIYYYDIYASELAALSTPRKSYCPEALDIAAEIEASEFVSDPNIAADVVVVRNICSTIFLEESPSTTEPAAPPATLEETPTANP
jgi:hypothetical protein